MSISTGHGDKGLTTLGNRRLAKSSLSSQMVGAIDELHVCLGQCYTVIQKNDPTNIILNVLANLIAQCLELGSKVHIFNKQIMNNDYNWLWQIYYKWYPKYITVEIGRVEDVTNLKLWIEWLESKLPKQKKFILFIDLDDDVLTIHQARTKARQVERLWTSMGFAADDPHNALLNKLSDFLHLVARYLQSVIKYKPEIFRGQYSPEICSAPLN